MKKIERLPMGELLQVISLGAGLQSSVMALMAAAGEITPMPRCGVFADTQDETPETYEWLAYLETQLPFPVVRVTAGKLSSTFGESFVHIPAFRLKGDEVSKGKKQCTRHFKLKPIYRYFRKELKATSKNPVICWVGITTDEVSRVKPARVKYVQNRWPFIEKEWNRYKCETWIKAHGYEPVPKSACEFCPLHSNATWRGLSAESKERAFKIDDFLRETRGEYLHQSCRPLREIDFSTEEERGQLNMFNNECEGMCGV
jgi:hypothetical protein